MKVLSVAKNLVGKMMVELGLKARAGILTPALTGQVNQVGRTLAESAPISSAAIKLENVKISNGKVFMLLGGAFLGLAVGLAIYERVKYVIYLNKVNDAASINTKDFL